MKAITLDLADGKPIVGMRDMPIPKIAPDEVLLSKMYQFAESILVWPITFRQCGIGLRVRIF